MRSREGPAVRLAQAEAGHDHALRPRAEDFVAHEHVVAAPHQITRRRRDCKRVGRSRPKQGQIDLCLAERPAADGLQSRSATANVRDDEKRNGRSERVNERRVGCIEKAMEKIRSRKATVSLPHRRLVTVGMALVRPEGCLWL